MNVIHNCRGRDVNHGVHGAEEIRVHLDSSAEKVAANDAVVNGETALEPPKYHLLIASTTLAFSATNLESSFPSNDTPICTQPFTS